MDAEILQGFIKQTEEYLPLVRGGILVCSQSGGVYGELSTASRQISSIRNSASILGLNRIEDVCARFERELKQLSADGAANSSPLGDEDARRLLDRLAELEVLVAEIYFGAEDFPASVANFVEESFGQFEPQQNNFRADESARDEEKFEIDAEMLEVFALEADDLVRNFRRNLELLEKPLGRKSGEALPEMRRSAHTLKGSAGVVGLKDLSQFAHRVEDLLDYLAENEIACSERIFELLLAASDCFDALAANEASVQLTKKIERIAENIDAALLEAARSESNAKRETPNRESKEKNLQTENRVEAPKSIVRVSLDRLDELVEIANDLRADRALFERRFDENDLFDDADFKALFARQYELIEAIQNKLLRLRMVRFGSLAPRFERTVRVACEEEQKRAELFIEGEDLEIDTQTLDNFVELLLHLLRNAVAHGVEAPDLRRLLGKPETGVIRLSVRSEKTRAVVTIADDGRGISADALREKAVTAGFLSRSRAEQMTDAEAFELIFLNGLTTAETLSQTAGRGVGMNVVKTGVERAGGTISIESEATRGTTFTVCLPTLSVSQPSRAEPLSILIVDDSPSIRQATSNAIKSAGWKSQTAENGVQALKILRGASRLPDVILTDAEMPQMDGYAFLSVLKNAENLRPIPVVMITSRTDDAFRQKAVNLGASDFLTKPCDNKILLERIRSLVK